MITFYYHPSPNPAKVALLLEEAGLDYEVAPVDTRKGEQFEPAFLAINPNAKTPALTDGDAKLFDSTAILLYLARKTGKFLVDTSNADHAQMLSWLMLVATGIGPYSGQAVHFKHFAPEPKDYAVNRYMYEAERYWGLVEAQLGKGRYMVADTYSIVDMSVWGWARALPFIFGPEAWAHYPNVKRLLDEITARPAAARVAELATRFTFKQEMDEEARKMMFPSNQRLAAARAVTDIATYTPPKVWTWAKENGGRFANINRPIAGATHDQDLPVGRHALQLYSLATPNGVKATVMLEELLELGHEGAEYDAWLIRIGEGDQFGSGFVEVNPNSKIPALMDHSGPTSIRVFESGAILMHLAEKFGAFLPTTAADRAECLSWLFWQVGSAPYLGGGFGHFYAYAPTKIEYAIDRFAMEVKRELDVLDRRLADNAYLSGPDYTIADIAVWPWYGGLAKGLLYEAGDFLAVESYTNVQRWADAIAARPAVQRGRMVNRTWGEPASQLHERHEASDFASKT